MRSARFFMGVDARLNNPRRDGGRGTRNFRREDILLPVGIHDGVMGEVLVSGKPLGSPVRGDIEIIPCHLIHRGGSRVPREASSRVTW